MNTTDRDPLQFSKTRVVIVGAGPIGLELAVALTRQRWEFAIIDSGVIGQTMTWWAPQTRWFSSNERIAIAGVPLLTVDQSKATREQYLTYLRSVASEFGIRVRCYERVIEVRRRGDAFTVVTEVVGGIRETECERVVLAIGGTDRPRRLGVEGEDLPHVDAYLREPHRYFGRDVLIVGGRNSAIEAALRLHHAGARVSLSYRGAALPEEGIKYWLLPEILGLIRSGRVQAHLATRVVRISPHYVTLESIADSTAGERIEVQADDVLSLIGYEQDKSLFRKLGIALIDSSERPRIDEETMETNIPGIYVAGTAVAGTQNSHYKTFLENCHQHVDKIVAHITGRSARAVDELYQQELSILPES